MELSRVMRASWCVAAAVAAGACGPATRPDPAESTVVSSPGAGEGEPAAETNAETGAAVEPEGEVPVGESGAPTGRAAEARAALPEALVVGFDLMERLVVQLNATGSDCDARAEALLAFGKSEDGERMRRLGENPELKDVYAEHKEDAQRAYPDLERRFIRSLETCAHHERFEAAMDESGMFQKKAVPRAKP